MVVASDYSVSCAQASYNVGVVTGYYGFGWKIDSHILLFGFAEETGVRSNLLIQFRN